MPNRDKRGQMGSNGAKRGHKGPYGAKRGQKGQTGQRRPNGVNRADFLHACIYLLEEKIIFSKPSTQTKIGRAMGILLIPRF